MPSKAYKTFQKNLNQVNKLIETYNHELERNSGRGKKSLDHLTRACLKKAFCKMCVTICGIFCPDEGAVAGYGN